MGNRQCRVGRGGAEARSRGGAGIRKRRCRQMLKINAKPQGRARGPRAHHTGAQTRGPPPSGSPDAMADRRPRGAETQTRAQMQRAEARAHGCDATNRSRREAQGTQQTRTQTRGPGAQKRNLDAEGPGRVADARAQDAWAGPRGAEAQTRAQKQAQGAGAQTRGPRRRGADARAQGPGAQSQTRAQTRGPRRRGGAQGRRGADASAEAVKQARRGAAVRRATLKIQSQMVFRTSSSPENPVSNGPQTPHCLEFRFQRFSWIPLRRFISDATSRETDRMRNKCKEPFILPHWFNFNSTLQLFHKQLGVVLVEN